MNVLDMDAKTALNQFCQRLCQRPVTKSDIVYTVNKIGPQFQAIVKLNCIQGQEFAGELSPNPKEAEKAAAHQALQAHASTIAALPPPVVAKKRKPAAGAAPGVPLIPGAPMAENGPGEMDGENPALTDKVKLNAACMRIAKRALQKGETIYEARQTVGGYQATVRLTCLPQEWAGKVWAGQVCTTKQAAEQSAAGMALAAINADPEMGAAATKPTAPATKGSGKGKGRGKGKGKGFWSMGWSRPPTGPDLPRERVTDDLQAGEVLEWRGSYGWIKPHVDIEHEAATRREGKVYVHQQDLVGTESLESGSIVRFQVYCDPSGLGAEEVTPL